MVDYLTVPALVHAPLIQPPAIPMSTNPPPTVPPPLIPPPLIPPAPSSGLAPQQVTDLIAARDRSAKLRRAAAIARFDAWMIAVFAALTGLTGLFSLSSLLLAGGMGFIAWNEFRGVRALRRLDPAAPKSLAINQICLAAILIAYALFQVYQSATAPGEYAAMAGGDAQLTEMLGPIDQLVTLLTMSVYGLIIFVAIFVQGGTALYYFTRQKYLRAYLTSTPSWILDLQQSGVTI